MIQLVAQNAAKDLPGWRFWDGIDEFDTPVESLVRRDTVFDPIVYTLFRHDLFLVVAGGLEDQIRSGELSRKFAFNRNDSAV